MNSGEIIGCGELIIRTSSGSQYSAVSDKHRIDTSLCFFKDVPVMGFSLASFPLYTLTTNYQTDFLLDKDTMLKINSEIVPNMNSLSIEYEGVGTKPCVITPVTIRCDIPANIDNTKRIVRVWLIFNGFARVDTHQMFTYYDYLSITATNPTGQLIHLTNKEILVTSANIVNTADLTCVMVGDRV
jgi:hypothetical protein